MKEIAVLSVTSGPTLSQDDLNYSLDVANKLKKRLEKRVILCAGTHTDPKKIETISKLLENNVPKTIIDIGRFSCLDRKPTGAHGHNEITSTIASFKDSFKDSVVLLVTDVAVRSTENCPIKAFLKNNSFNKNVLIDTFAASVNSQAVGVAATI